MFIKFTHSPRLLEDGTCRLFSGNGQNFTRIWTEYILIVTDKLLNYTVTEMCPADSPLS